MRHKRDQSITKCTIRSSLTTKRPTSILTRRSTCHLAYDFLKKSSSASHLSSRQRRMQPSTTLRSAGSRMQVRRPQQYWRGSRRRQGTRKCATWRCSRSCLGWAWTSAWKQSRLICGAWMIRPSRNWRSRFRRLVKTHWSNIRTT